MTRPNITPGGWSTSREFPGSVIAGDIAKTERGKSAHVVCRVMGEVLPTWKHDLKAVSAVPDLLAALEACLVASEYAPYTGAAKVLTKAALIKAGYTFP